MAKRGGKAADMPLSRFGVLVAQLESIVASAPQQPPDALLCFDLLSELVSAIEEEPKEAIIHWQRKCEDALYSLLVLGARRPVRRLASLAMVRVIAKGDHISIYSRVSSLQGWLAEGKRSEPLSCAGVAQCLGELYRIFGRRITSGLTETTSIASKLMKFHEDFVRQDALLMLQNALEGSCGSGAPAAFSEAFRIITRLAISDKAYNVRLAAARCLKTFANIRGPGLGIAELENAASYCIKALEDPASSVRDAFAEALGAIVALGMNPQDQMSHKGRNTGPPKKLEGGLQKYLIVPFMKANGVRAKDVRIGFTLSWVFFLQVIHLRYHVLDSELQDFALQAMEMLQSDPSVDAHALACVLYILRVGVTDQMTEPTQRKFLVLLGRQLESSDLSPSIGVAVLRIVSYLLTTLGEVPLEFKEILDNTVVAALSHSSIHVRVEASLTLRTLAEVDPTCVGGLISYGVTTLNALRDSASIEKGNRLKVELDSLHGQATALAALVSISPRLLLGYPARLPKSVFEVSKKMLTERRRNTVAATVEKEAGWLLLASLITSMPKKELEDQVFDILILWAGPFAGNIEVNVEEAQDLNSELCVLSVALEALTAFIKSFVSPIISTSGVGVLLQPVLVYLSGALSCIQYLRVRQKQSAKPSLDMFTIRTLIAYQSLLDPLTYKADHHQIIEICSSPFSDPYGCEESSCLRFLLDKRDVHLGPWMPGRDWLEDELRAFEGGKDGVLPCLWEDQVPCFPQPENVRKMLVNQMLLCLGSIFATLEHVEKLRLLNIVDQCLKAGKKHSWHVASITNACVVLLAGIKAVLALRVQTLEDEILSSMQLIFQNILAEGEIYPAQRRASCEGLGLLARLGNDSYTARMARSLLCELATATDPSYIGSLALSLGCIHRSAGGMALSTLVPATVNSISSLARSSNADMQLWSLHSLLLTIEAAGLSYVSQVQATLTLAIDILLADENGSVDLRQGIGHLINAIVAVIGPELAPGSTFFSRSKSVVAETSSGKETSTLLESVRFTQQLVLFAPQAVSVHSHVQTLLPTLSSRQPTLRHLAVSTLRHLIEKDPVTMIEEQIEEKMFRLLDEETDSEIGNLVRTTISRLLYASCPSCPSRWLALCRSMVLATSKGSNVSEERASTEVDTSNGSSNSVGDTRLYHGEDDENMIASSAAPKMQDSVSTGNVYLKGDKHLRYRTRVFAAECLSCLPQAVGINPAHFDLMLARRHAAKAKGHSASSDWLVLHLQELVSLAYQISTSQFEGMQPIGVKLLITIMDKFGRIPDPELPGHLLVEQYQAQFVSAIRSAISISSGPSLLEAGLQLATKILTSSMLGGDRVALQRMFSLISHPLHDFDDLYYPSFAEWAACKIKTRLLAAHASIKCYVYTLLRERKSLPDEYLQLIPLFSDTSGTLGKYWISILKDYSYISFGIRSKLSDRPFLEGIQSPLVSSRVKPCLDEAWPLILQASALDAVPRKFEMGLKDSPKQGLLSGYIMVQLEQRQFDFLWGLALLTLFQSKTPAVDSGETPFLCNGLMRSCGEQMLEETLGHKLFEIALITLQSLSTDFFFNANFISVYLSKELLQVLLHGDHMAESWDNVAIPLFSKILQFCHDVFLDAEDFISLATELCVKYLYRTCLRYDLLSHDHTIVENLISATLNAAERLVCQSNYQKYWNLKLACLSISYKCLQRTSVDLCSSKLIAFLHNIAPLFRKFFEDDALHDDARKILEVWVSVVSDLFEDCIKKLHLLDKQTNDAWKLLAKKLAFCLEDIIFIARIAHEMLAKGDKDSRSIFLSSYKHCIKCVKMTLTDVNAKIQAIGLLVLKTMAQKEHGEGLDLKSRHFSLLFSGEILEEIFSLMQDTLKKPMRRESIVVCEECLRFLFLFHTLSQGHECFNFSTSLLLEGTFMISSASVDMHLLEVNEMKTMAMRLISHLVQVPSTAAQIKETLLSMPTTRRQLLQDIIRSSVSLGPKESQVTASTPSPIINLPVHLEVRQSPQESASDSAHLHFHSEATKEEIDGDGEFDDVGSDDDWDAFQSFPAADMATATTQIETDNPLIQSPVLGTEYQPSGSTLITVTDEVISKESLDDVKDNASTSIENEMQDPLCSKPCTDDEHVLEADDGRSELLDASGPQPVDYDKDLENGRN